MNRPSTKSDWHYYQVSETPFALAPGSMPGPTPRHLRLVCFNSQTSITTSRYRHYLTHSWKQSVPRAERLEILDRVAAAHVGSQRQSTGEPAPDEEET